MRPKSAFFAYTLLGPVAAALVAASAFAHDTGSAAARKLGTVSFPVSCSAAAQKLFTQGVAELHSFWFPAARERFEQVLQADPSCVMAYWGQAINLLSNPLASGPTPKALAAGLAGIEKGLALGPKSERERRWLDAIGAYYRDHDKLDNRTRALAYEQAMGKLAADFPDDHEAQIFYALAIDINVQPTDKTYANQLKAAAILEKEFARQPNHPGVAHYLIHSYDYPPIAKQGVAAARRYAKIAPDAPHALHMPSHIFTRLGYWEESAATNAASARIADRDSAITAPGTISGEGMHARDYMEYAYLQLGRDRAAKALVKYAETPKPGVDNPAFLAAPYALAAMPMRYVIEREQWSEAKALALSPTVADWSKFPEAEAVHVFGKGLAAARSGDVAAAKAAFARLGELHDALAKQKKDYWAGQAEIQGRAVRAWIALAEGDKGTALEQMRMAADQEDLSTKHIVTPGHLTPARELLGDMLLKTGDAAAALAAFEKTLTVEPKRYRALLGAARSAEAAGDKAKAIGYWRQFAALTAKSDGSRPEVKQVRQKLAALR
jgi:hypothetical protein